MMKEYKNDQKKNGDGAKRNLLKKEISVGRKRREWLGQKNSQK